MRSTIVWVLVSSMAVFVLLALHTALNGDGEAALVGIVMYFIVLAGYLAVFADRGGSRA
ncbi:hypothetical protein [Halostella sp. PRR32]|uniref:hypothetical protein n=1 Tax=Halostella sp. PRR32 TaxID=3098147 RepID=UPI002B1D7E66|nr:hypothetical protein [Halostella sp. PRR32]